MDIFTTLALTNVESVPLSVYAVRIHPATAWNARKCLLIFKICLLVAIVQQVNFGM
jgi:hypothetical protein